MKKYGLLILCCLFLIQSIGQNENKYRKKIYKFNRKLEIPVIAGLWGLNFYGLSLLNQKPTLDTAEVLELNKNDVWAFDRIALNQTYPAPAGIYTASDIGLWTSWLLPALLFIDDDIRSDWLDVTLLYLETQAINFNIYLFAGPVFTRRVRPLIYYEDEDWEYKLGKKTTDSFFSGHASMTAGASFFMAKVLCDYHPELGGKRFLIYLGALVPPVIVGWMRYRGMLHFPTDVLLGIGIGAAVGILNPHFHKITRKIDKDMSIIPYAGPYSGIAFIMKF